MLGPSLAVRVEALDRAQKLCQEALTFRDRLGRRRIEVFAALCVQCDRRLQAARLLGDVGNIIPGQRPRALQFRASIPLGSDVRGDPLKVRTLLFHAHRSSNGRVQQDAP